MKFAYTVAVDAPAARVWAVLADIPLVAQCLPGVSGVTAAGPGIYHGTMRVKVGPVVLTLAGQVREEERDEANTCARLRAEAADRRVGGSVRALLLLAVRPLGPATSEVQIEAEAQLVGKLGEFGQPVIRAKADQIFREFSHALGQQLAHAGPGSGPAPAPAAGPLPPAPPPGDS
ncbi:MAG: SRPBCC family protein [Chloroflexi bacterium]|nr:SRPBCC family protein [Chloroflexota bacterium]